MEKIILDTSFILTAVKNKIDFFENLLGYEILIPLQVIKELEGLKKSNPVAETCLKILEKNRFEKIDLKNKNTDKGIINYSNKNPKTIVATFDREIKSKIENKKIIMRGKIFEV